MLPSYKVLKKIIFKLIVNEQYDLYKKQYIYSLYIDDNCMYDFMNDIFDIMDNNITNKYNEPYAMLIYYIRESINDTNDTIALIEIRNTIDLYIYVTNNLTKIANYIYDHEYELKSDFNLYSYIMHCNCFIDNDYNKLVFYNDTYKDYCNMIDDGKPSYPNRNRYSRNMKIKQFMKLLNDYIDIVNKKIYTKKYQYTMSNYDTKILV